MAKDGTSSHVRNYAVGSFGDDGRMGEQEVGFKPRYVKVVNVTGLAVMEYFEGMSDAEALKLVKIADDGSTSTDNLSLETTNGITVSDNSFTVGDDDDVNPAGDEDMYWVAVG